MSKPKRNPVEPDLVERAIALLKRQAKSCRLQLADKAGRSLSPRTVHRQRVASRSLLALLGLIERLVGSDGQLRKPTRWRLGRLSKLRDAQAQVDWLSGEAPRHPEIHEFSQRIQARAERLAREAAKDLGQGPRPRLRRGARAMGRRLRAWARDLGPAASRTLQQAWMADIDDAHARAMRRQQALDPDDGRSLHRLRLAFKCFRYRLLAWLAIAAPEAGDPPAALGAYQDRLGKLHDLEVLLARLDRHLADHPESAPALARYRKSLQTRHARRLATFLRSKDDLEGFWPPDVSGSL